MLLRGGAIWASAALGLLAAGCACDMGTPEPGAIPIDPNSIRLILLNESGLPVRADVVFLAGQTEVRRTSRYLAPSGRESNTEVIPTVADALRIEARETVLFSVSRPGDVIVQRTLVRGVDFQPGDTLEFVIRKDVLNQPPTPAITVTPGVVVDAGQQVTLDASASSDPDGDVLTFSWRQTAGPSVGIDGATTSSVTFTAPTVSQLTTLSIELTADDGLDPRSATIEIMIRPGSSGPPGPNPIPPLNLPPVADAGPDQQISSGALVQLDGTASSDPEGQPLSFSWKQTSGDGVSLSGETGSSPSFTAPEVPFNQTRVLEFELSVQDNVAQTSSDGVRVTVNGPAAPALLATASADPAEIAAGGTATLAASGQGGVPPFSFAWTVMPPEGANPGQLVDPGASMTLWHAPQGQTGLWTFVVTVSDSLGQAADASIAVSVQPDCNTNGLIDSTEPDDCNTNGSPDPCDIATGESIDENANGVADECDPFAGVRLVDADAGGANTGVSWADAYTSLQSALLAASESNSQITQIWIAAGTYTPDDGSGDRQATFELHSGLALLGGFAGGETAADQRDPFANPTTLSGDLDGDDAPIFTHYLENSLHVVTAVGVDATCILDGLTITGGYADGGDGDQNGGGLLCIDSSPTLIDCAVRANFAAGDGGGLMNDGGSPTLVNCEVSGNFSGFNGAGLMCQYGSVTMINGVLVGNGGADGAALRVLGGAATLVNCSFALNEGYITAGGASIEDGSAVVTNCVFWFNFDEYGTSEEAQVRAIDSTLDINYSCVMGLTGELGGVGNIGENPLFLDADGPDGIAGSADDDLRLSAGSPCIDAGNNAALPADALDLDRDGDLMEPLPLDIRRLVRLEDDPATDDAGVGAPPLVDMGAHEYDPAS